MRQMRCCPEIQGHQASRTVPVSGVSYPASSTAVLHAMDQLGKYCTCRARACCSGFSRPSSRLRSAGRFRAGPVLAGELLEIFDSAQGRNLPAQGQHPSIARLTPLVKPCASDNRTSCRPDAGGDSTCPGIAVSRHYSVFEHYVTRQVTIRMYTGA